MTKIKQNVLVVKINQILSVNPSVQLFSCALKKLDVFSH
jgi:hypothetical protein